MDSKQVHVLETKLASEKSSFLCAKSTINLDRGCVMMILLPANSSSNSALKNI